MVVVTVLGDGHAVDQLHDEVGAAALGGAGVEDHAGWKGDGLQTVADVEEYFARVCFEADKALGEPTACRYFLNWFDETPRGQMRAQLLSEVERALTERGIG
jgi:hypothetical protein